MAELEHSQANALRVLHVERCFGASGQPLALEGRTLLGEGVLTKVCRKSAKPRQFFLFSDLLVYGTIVKDKKKYKNQVVLPLQEIGIVTVKDSPDIRNAWQITHARRSFTVFAATPREKSEWVSHICSIIGKPAATEASKRPAGHAPAWVPDTRANLCMHCQVKRFSAVSRRHHCRQCGMVVCKSCSSKRFLLPDQSNKRVRVCDTCYDKLSSGVEAPSQAAADADGQSLDGVSVAESVAEEADMPEDPNDFSSIGNIQEAGDVLAALTAERPTTFYPDATDETEPLAAAE